MCTQRCLLFRDPTRPRRVPDASCLAPAGFVEPVQLRESAFLEAEPLAQNLHERAVHLRGELYEGTNGGLHACVYRRRVRAVNGPGPRQRVVLRDIDELHSVERASLVHGIRPRSLVSAI